jgi:hypothetical protein
MRIRQKSGFIDMHNDRILLTSAQKRAFGSVKRRIWKQVSMEPPSSLEDVTSPNGLQMCTYLFPVKFALNDNRFGPGEDSVGLLFRVRCNVGILAPKSVSAPFDANEEGCLNANSRETRVKSVVALREVEFKARHRKNSQQSSRPLLGSQRTRTTC